MGQMLDFIAPLQSPLLIAFVQKAYPILSVLRNGRFRIELSAEVMKEFAELKGRRTIICSNHPAEADGFVLFGISARLKEAFAYLTARDVFGDAVSLQAKCLQKVGCYSVLRGTADLHAFKESCRLLKDSVCKLVIFPEGEISYKNGLLREFESGPELIALSTLHDLRQSGSEDKIFILPLALKYRYSRDIKNHLARVMRLVEQKLRIDLRNLPLAERISRAYLKLLEKYEKQYEIAPGFNADIDSRLSAICEERISEVERFAGIQSPVRLSRMRRIHLLMNAVAERQCKEKYLKTLSKSAKKLSTYYYEQLKKIVAFMAVNRHSFDHELTQEEAAELIRHLADELSVKMPVAKPDICCVAAARVIDVDEFLPVSRFERKKSVQDLKSELRDRIALRLDELEKSFSPVLLSGIRPGSASCDDECASESGRVKIFPPLGV